MDRHDSISSRIPEDRCLRHRPLTRVRGFKLLIAVSNAAIPNFDARNNPMASTQEAAIWDATPGTSRSNNAFNRFLPFRDRSDSPKLRPPIYCCEGGHNDSRQLTPTCCRCLFPDSCNIPLNFPVPPPHLPTDDATHGCTVPLSAITHHGLGIGGCSGAFIPPPAWRIDSSLPRPAPQWGKRPSLRSSCSCLTLRSPLLPMTL